MAKKRKHLKEPRHEKPKGKCGVLPRQTVYEQMIHNLQGHKTLLEFQHVLLAEQETLVGELKPEIGS